MAAILETERRVNCVNRTLRGVSPPRVALCALELAKVRRIELRTRGFGIRRSATELHRYVRPIAQAVVKARNGTRTHTITDQTPRELDAVLMKGDGSNISQALNDPHSLRATS